MAGDRVDRDALAARITEMERGGSSGGMPPRFAPSQGGERDAAAAATPEPGRRRSKPKADLAFAEALPHQRALDLAYKLVAQRERTAKQLREKLAAKDLEPAAIDAALDELQRYGFQSDERYARLYAEDKRRLQAWGDRRIRQELQLAGVPRDVIDAVLADEDAFDAPSELDAALELLRRKQPDLSDPKIKQRMAGMLARRGIASATVFAALRRYQAEHSDEG